MISNVYQRNLPFRSSVTLTRTAQIRKMATIQRVARLAHQTFSKKTSDKSFNDNFKRLKQLMKHVTAADLNFNQELVKNREIFKPESGQPPVTYVALWEDECFSMGVFVLKNGVTLPLHDHPGMYGICKAISGTLRVRRYTALADDGIQVPSELSQKYAQWTASGRTLLQPMHESPVLFVNGDVDCDVCSLSPSGENFHEMKAVNGPAAFLDVLSPPYNTEQDRVCHYFRDVTPKSESSNAISSQKSSVSWLLRTSQPFEFWCDTDPYTGPTVHPLEMQSENFEVNQPQS